MDLFMFFHNYGVSDGPTYYIEYGKLYNDATPAEKTENAVALRHHNNRTQGTFTPVVHPVVRTK